MTFENARPREYRDANDNLEFLENDYTIKTLGIVWNPTQDVFIFKVAHVEEDTFDKNDVTKLQMLSDISETSDPLGWLSPVTIQLKQMKLPDHLVNKYLDLRWRSKLISLEEMKLERLVFSDGFADKVDIHLLCDSSENANAACIYIVASTTDSNTQSCLMVAKTKVTPIKSQSIPHLELSAALLGARLLMSSSKAINQLNLQIGTQYAWSVSISVLSKFSREPSHWSAFVSNRVSEIQGQVSNRWNHDLKTIQPILHHGALMQMQSRHTRIGLTGLSP